MTTSNLNPAELLGETIGNDRYKITARLGEGSMAHVFRAFDKHLETDVVIKVPIRQYLDDPDFRTRFYQESQLLVRLSHPHVVKIIDVGEYSAIPFVVLQFLGGGSLQTRLRQRPGRQMPPESLGDWLLQVAGALDFMDGQKIIHRDVKPGNILFDEHHNVFLSDFGLTKVAAETQAENENPSLTAAGAIVGTPNYVAPEIVMGLRYDGRADQYSLATTVFEVLTGRPPLIGPTSSATMVNQTKKLPPLLSEVNPAFSRELSLAVHRGLAKRPAERFASSVQFAQAVLSAISGEGSGSNSASPARRPVASGVTTDARGNRSAVGSGSSHALVSRGKPGQVPCPKCRRSLPLKEKHAGRRGRCIQCHSLLQVAKNLASLKFIDETRRSSAAAAASGSRLQLQGGPGVLPPRMARGSKSEEHGNDSDEMILGERVFKWRVSKRTAAILGGILLTITLLAVIFVMNWKQGQETEKLKEDAKQFGRE